ncbi:hypothetical protein ACWGPD_20485 [Streptomyces hirsutus]|uniref:hypothetical protein n=1 Tax=Streptomyces hirsutus TaxID=35620 RepID=UPI00363F6FDE
MQRRDGPCAQMWAPEHGDGGQGGQRVGQRRPLVEDGRTRTVRALRSIRVRGRGSAADGMHHPVTGPARVASAELAVPGRFDE